jgi:hypothetical protein
VATTWWNEGEASIKVSLVESWKVAIHSEKSIPAVEWKEQVTVPHDSTSIACASALVGRCHTA